jgi:hypothetical protein
MAAGYQAGSQPACAGRRAGLWDAQSPSRRADAANPAALESGGPRPAARPRPCAQRMQPPDPNREAVACRSNLLLQRLDLGRELCPLRPRAQQLLSRLLSRGIQCVRPPERLLQLQLQRRLARLQLPGGAPLRFEVESERADRVPELRREPLGREQPGGCLLLRGGGGEEPGAKLAGFGDQIQAKLLQGGFGLPLGRIRTLSSLFRRARGITAGRVS